MVTTVASAPAFAESSSDAPAASADSALTDSQRAADATGATRIAERFGHPVAIDAATTPTSQVSALPDGSMQLASSSLPVRVKSGSSWVPVDTTLQSPADGFVAPKAAAAQVAFGAGGSDVMAKVQTATGSWITEKWPYGPLPVPAVHGSTATYSGVLRGVDLRLTATAAGMSEVLVIHSAAAAANPKVASLTLRIGGANVSAEGTKAVKAAAADGSSASSSSPIWWDSSHAGSGPSGPGGDGGLRPLGHSVSGSAVTMDVSSATSTPSLTYPVYVDPDWAVGQQHYWFTDRAYASQSYLDGQYADGIQSVGNGGGYLSRAFWEFGTSPLNGKHVLAATFSATEIWSNTCSGRDIQAWHYGNATPGFSWSGDPGMWNSLQDTKNLSAGSSCSPASAVGFSVTGAAAWAASNSVGRVQIGLRAANDTTDTLTRRHFAQGATLTVTYNTPPNNPATPVMVAPPRGCGTATAPDYISKSQQMTLQVSQTDPDPGSGVNVAFYVYNSAGTQIWSGGAPQQAQGQLRATVPAATIATWADGQYSWKARAGDNIDLSPGFSTPCTFVIKSTHPGLPGMTIVSGATVVGAPMTVKFTSAAADHIARFAYWWTPTHATSPSPIVPATTVTTSAAMPACGTVSGPVTLVCADTTGASPNVVVAPVSTPSTLWVATYDAAGNPSLDAAGTSAAAGFEISPLTDDTTNVSTTAGHIWDTTNSSTTDTSVPDLNTVAGSSGTTTRQVLGQPLKLVTSKFFGIPTTVLDVSATSKASQSERTAIDTKNSFTASVWVQPSTTAATGVEHVAMSENSLGTTVFTLGTDAAGAAKFCRTSLVNSARACVTGGAPVPGKWTLVTGIWDAVNGNLRILINDSITAAGVTPQAVPANDTSPTGWLCAGASCSLVSGSMVSTSPWEGQLYRPSVFPGVISRNQLDNVFGLLAPNAEPPADTSIGAVVNQSCSQLITPAQMYAYDPNLSGLVPWTPAAGTPGARALQLNGVACQWMRESGNVSMYVSVANITDRGTLAQLQTAAQGGTPVAGLGDAAYYANNQLQVFRGGYWIVFQYAWSTEGADFFPLPQDVLAALP